MVPCLNLVLGAASSSEPYCVTECLDQRGGERLVRPRQPPLCPLPRVAALGDQGFLLDNRDPRWATAFLNPPGD